ncbi:endocuticle structural glycoprotein SgAbd-2-like [Amphibalanus amphitrite]|uniref:endocuticle structural glycoprotein SgAbd-2-like n=1 Tax=Amphibalanus amphitrite TaxID=1232801 RepID=UPI001C9051AB|nr:endocuticle structural glycoprotein SgAbd-2-like [Amphibalanus amphitrite]
MHSVFRVLLLLLGLSTVALSAKLDHLSHHHGESDLADQPGQPGQPGQHDQPDRSGPHGPLQKARETARRPALSRTSQTAPTEPPVVPIVRLDHLQREDGSFQYGYQTGNQIQADVEGRQRQIGDAAGTVMRGRYSYLSPEGHRVRVHWTADENGFRAVGENLGLPPQE